MEYRRAFGHHPRTWREFSYGLAHLARHHARDMLRLAAATTVAHAPDTPDRRDWYCTQRIAADW